MRRLAPYLAALAGAALLVVVLVVCAVALSGAGSRRAALEARLDAVSREAASLRESVEAVRLSVEALRKDLPALGARVDSPAAVTQRDSPPPESVEPPPGEAVAVFDESDDGWKVPEWASGSARRIETRELVRRGAGSLALGCVYGAKPPAVAGPVSPRGQVLAMAIHARTLSKTVVLGIGVEEAGGARYEDATPLAPQEGWKMLPVDLRAFKAAPGSDDPDGRLDARNLKAVYVADRSVGHSGGNVLLIDDVVLLVDRRPASSSPPTATDAPGAGSP